MNVLPTRLRAMSEAALLVVADPGQRDDLRTVAGVVSEAVWQHWFAWRPPEDNRQEHEWVVFANVLAIAEAEGLTLSEKRVAVAFAFTHDTCFIPRITETMIREAADEATRARLAAGKEQQRLAHMAGGVANARFLFGQLNHPARPGQPLLTPLEIDQCAGIIAGHDLWKLRRPHPPGNDRLAVVCLEADALWPLHPLGVMADLERPDEHGRTRNSIDPAAWQAQIRNSLLTLWEYRANWAGIPGESFHDNESIFRTAAGHRLYRQWLAFWGLVG